MSRRTPIRHGEVLLVPVDSVPPGKVERVSSCIVGHSESGHHHVLESGELFNTLVAANGDLYVDLNVPTPLRHLKTQQQHRELSVPTGAWRVINKKEFDVRSAPMHSPVKPIAPMRPVRD